MEMMFHNRAHNHPRRCLHGSNVDILSTIVFTLSLLFMITSASAEPAKFERWFPISATRYEYTSSHVCAGNLSEYREERDHATCSYQFQCILTHLHEDVKARMASASVLLGLTPGLLASLGPSVAEISLLSTERPLLSMLLSLGSPAVFPDRVLKYQSALRILDEPFYGPSFAPFKTSVWLQNFTSAAQYVLAIGAIANIASMSWALGVRTILTFDCLNSYLPLVWTSLPILVHLPSALAFLPFARWWHEQFTTTSGASKGLKKRNLLQKEADLCVTRKKVERPRVSPSAWALVLINTATVFGFLHVAFGIAIYSSLLFIEPLDVVLVILRYMCSTVVCRVILMFELSGIRRVDAEQPGMSR